MDSNAFNMGGVNVSHSSLSPAALLSEQHARDDQHKVTVEDVIDEEDLNHPPPSLLKSGLSNTIPATVTAEPPIPKHSAPSAPHLDVQSEELFPALGSGPKPNASASMPMTWGAKRVNPAYSSTNGFPTGPRASGKPLVSSIM